MQGKSIRKGMEMSNSPSPAKVGVIGTGFIGSGLVKTLMLQSDIQVSRVLTRRPLASLSDVPWKEHLTNSADDLIENSDVVVECSGDVLYASKIIKAAFAAGKPVVTMNSELHVTTGSWFVGKGYLTEAEGDQPGCLAALNENLRQMGFRPVVYGNIKGFLNEDPKPEEMAYWGKRNHLSLPMVSSFTDGTKVEIEQALVANGLGADIFAKGMARPMAASVNDGALRLAEMAESLGHPISDYILCKTGPAGVFITARYDQAHHDALQYLKLGDGPYYTLIMPFHLCYMEIPKTIRRALEGRAPLLTNSANPVVSVGAVAKHDMKAGTKVPYGIGSFDFRGKAVRIREHAGHLPIGLLRDAVLAHDVEKGQLLTFDDVELTHVTAVSMWKEIEAKALATAPTFID